MNLKNLVAPAAALILSSCADTAVKNQTSGLQSAVSSIKTSLDDTTRDPKLARDVAAMSLSTTNSYRYAGPNPNPSAGSPQSMEFSVYYVKPKETKGNNSKSNEIKKIIAHSGLKLSPIDRTNSSLNETFISFVCAPAANDRSMLQYTSLLATDIDAVNTALAPPPTDLGKLVMDLGGSSKTTDGKAPQAAAGKASIIPKDLVIKNELTCQSKVRGDLNTLLLRPATTSESRIAFLAVAALVPVFIEAYDAAKQLIVDAAAAADMEKRRQKLYAEIRNPDGVFATNVKNALGPGVYTESTSIGTGTDVDQQKQIAAHLENLASGAIDPNAGALTPESVNAVINGRRVATLIRPYAAFVIAMQPLPITGSTDLGLPQAKIFNDLVGIEVLLADYDQMLATAPADTAPAVKSLREGFWQLRRIAEGNLTQGEESQALSDTLTQISTSLGQLSKDFSTAQTDTNKLVTAIQSAAK